MGAGVPYGTLTLHGTDRDVELELISHKLANRIIRLHTGRKSAAEVFFRGDDIDEDTFGGETGILSINYDSLMSVRWDPYPMGDAGVSPGDEAPQLSRPTLLDALRVIVEQLELHDSLDHRETPPAEKAEAPSTSPPAGKKQPGRSPAPGPVPENVPTEPASDPSDATAGAEDAARSKPAKASPRPRRGRQD